MKEKNKSLYQANSAKKMQAYRARKLAKKQGISYENALSLIEGELREIDKKTEIAQKKKGTTKPKFRKGKNPTREEVELFAKKERVNVGHAFLILRGQWTLEKARSRKSKGCKCSGCSSGKACKLTWLRRVSGSYGSRK